jgi:hypothetical protein
MAKAVMAAEATKAVMAAAITAAAAGTITMAEQ